MNYFCDYCGTHFSANTPEAETACPHCGSWCCYPDTPEEAALSCKRLSDYEAETEDFI